MEHSELYAQSSAIFPGGVNSPVRSFLDAGQKHPLFIRSAYKSFVIDEKNRCLLDFVGSWGPMIHGHAHPKIINSVIETAKKGLSFGAPTKKETSLAELIQKFFPKMEKMRFTSSGTEAAMTAIRIARAATRRKAIIKFEGCYHGHSDSLLVKIGSAGASMSQALTSDGILPEVSQETHILPFNDHSALINHFEQYGPEIAGVIFEPIAGNMGCIPSTELFIQTIQNLCKKHGALCIVDEVMTGFRVAKGGASELYPQLDPDLYVLGKIVGGGMPLAVIGGKKEYLDLLAPLGPVYHAGTLSGNPIAVQAGITTLELLEKKSFYTELQEKTEYFCRRFSTILKQHHIPHSYYAYAGMFSLYQTDVAPSNFSDVKQQSLEHFQLFFKELLKEDIYWPPSMFEACFLSQAHTLDQLHNAAEKVATAWIYAKKILDKKNQNTSLRANTAIEQVEFV